MSRWLAVASALGLTGCGVAAIDQFETCELDVTLEVASAAPGQEVVLLGGPQTSPYDTRVEVGGVPAEVVGIERNAACSTCETCRTDAECLVCGTCLGAALDDANRVACFGDPFEGTKGICGDCEEQVAFVVPQLPAGPTTIVVLNRNGASAPLAFAIEGATSSTADTASTLTDTAPPTPTPTDVPTADTGAATTGDTGASVDTGAGTADTATATADTAVDTGPTGDTAATGATADTAPTADTADTGA